jgi:hypothetical protein
MELKTPFSYRMNNNRLDELLSRYKATAVPLTPGNLGQNVWREIRLRQSSPFSSALRSSEFLAWFRGSAPTLFAPVLTIALFVSIGLTMVTPQENPHRRVQKALGLEIFSHQSSPLTRLAQNP